MNRMALKFSNLKAKRTSVVAKQYWLITILCGTFLLLFNYFEVTNISTELLNRHITTQNTTQLHNSLNGYLINTPGCRIPDLDPFDSSIRQFVKPPSYPKCDQEGPPLFQSNLTSLYLVKSALPSYKSGSGDLKCCFKNFTRGSFEVIVPNKGCTVISNEVTHIESEFIQVTCTGSGSKNIIYQDFFIFVPVHSGNKLPGPAAPSVLILGLDAVSRINLHRQLPKTYSYLVKELEVSELLGYNKVADNTFPNLIPVLTGLSEKELKSTCWPNAKSYFDKCPFVWKKFSANNYVTAFGDDCGQLSLFNFEKKGFILQTSDYYYTSYYRYMERTIASRRNIGCFQCIGRKESYKLLLHDIKKFATRMALEEAAYFGFFWSVNLSHDDLNAPSHGDQTYYELFKFLKDKGHLENTFLIFMSDHGIRTGPIRQTYQGQMEERLPFLLMALPESFANKNANAVRNLKDNTRKLTTPFDLHETLNDILNITKAFGNYSEGLQRGYSLFKPIPENRTCEDAEIESHWCTCQQRVEVSVYSSEVIHAAQFAVFYINSLLKSYEVCATLTLEEILKARLLLHDKKHIIDNKSLKDYTIILKTKPGEAIFEVTVRLKGQEGIFNKLASLVDKWSQFNITGTISRLNLYGNQSYCITNYHLKLYCYCTSYL